MHPKIFRARKANESTPLLNLPGEILNRIYSFALFSPSGLHYKALPIDQMPQGQKSIFYSTTNHPRLPQASNFRKTRKTHYHEFNQLKYTCRKLYHETAGLELKLNPTITFTQDHTSTPAQDFLLFATTCTPLYLSWLKTITIGPSEEVSGDPLEDSISTFKRLGRFATANPHTALKYIIGGWTYPPSNACSLHSMLFIQTGVALSYLLRDRDLGSLGHGFVDVPKWPGIQKWREGEGVVAFQTNNLRFCPDLRALPERFGGELREVWGDGGILLERMEKDVRVWEGFARGWVEGGL
ncbi:hypothetical protein P154DRAFT_521733 [Amniculicola lignicola CBS 123094]|uniref:Uncharacterized protein n=1 Tax=Amniculicola lignicola CBS 123094 TaxID=1392246 RepID=A0A6A5WQH4_9PLEO|nr:hypothetical protein P154DRAFT_521733 [Amniculicola lignicola CBS 123094]